MLTLYRKLATKLKAYQQFISIIALLVTTAFVVVLLFGSPLLNEQWLLPLLVSLGLLLCLWLIVHFFADNSWQQAGKIKRFFLVLWHWLLALVLSAILLVWFFLFLRTVSAIIRQLW